MSELPRRRTLSLTAVMLATVVSLSTIPATASAIPGPNGPDGVPVTRPITGTSPAWAISARQVGLAPPGVRRHLTLLLNVARPDHLETEEDRVIGWLKRSGLKVSTIRCAGRIEADGSAAIIDSTFHTQLARFRTTGDDVRIAPLTDVLVPGELRAMINAIAGLADTEGTPDISPMFRAVQPQSAVACEDHGSPAFPAHASDNF
jgi:pro-kumamolisin-like protein